MKLPKFLERIIARPGDDEFLYALVVEELEAGVQRKGLWAKAVVAAGSQEAAHHEYIRLRVEQLRPSAGAIAERLTRIAEIDGQQQDVCALESELLAAQDELRDVTSKRIEAESEANRQWEVEAALRRARTRVLLGWLVGCVALGMAGSVLLGPTDHGLASGVAIGVITGLVIGLFTAGDTQPIVLAENRYSEARQTVGAVAAEASRFDNDVRAKTAELEMATQLAAERERLSTEVAQILA